jgi:hypothetical protein
MLLPATKNARAEHVGCMAVLDGNRVVAFASDTSASIGLYRLYKMCIKLGSETLHIHNVA